MKKFFILFFLILVSNNIFGQTSYIQVIGEPNLSIFLNNQFKGKTTVEYKGYIIENVTPGKNVIKIVKEGYTSYEETITVKTGEVFAYEVKPFSKNSVYISEQGNTGQTEKKETIETGKLIVQSLPIEIKITMPDIEGVNNIQKAKDKWMADHISTGDYEITFSFGEKVITKTIKIEHEKVTSVFINMLNGDFTVKTDEKLPYETREETIAYINQLLSTQGRVYYKTLWCSYCKNNVDNKLLKTYDVLYSSSSFTYSEQTKSYSFSTLTKIQSYGKNNGNHFETNNEFTTETNDIQFDGELIFEESTCGDNIQSGSCLRLWIKSKLVINLPNSNSIPQLKKAFLHLQELD